MFSQAMVCLFIFLWERSKENYNLGKNLYFFYQKFKAKNDKILTNAYFE